jgi:hypothetical protein
MHHTHSDFFFKRRFQNGNDPKFGVRRGVSYTDPNKRVESFVGLDCYRVVSYNASHAMRLLSDLLMHLRVIISISALWLQQTSRSETGRWREMPLNLADVVSLSYSAGIFNMP